MWIMTWKSCGTKSSWHAWRHENTIQGYVWRGWRKPWKILVIIAGLQAGIRIPDFLNTTYSADSSASMSGRELDTKSNKHVKRQTETDLQGVECGEFVFLWSALTVFELLKDINTYHAGNEIRRGETLISYDVNTFGIWLWHYDFIWQLDLSVFPCKRETCFFFPLNQHVNCQSSVVWIFTLPKS